jgi:uncharacterized protein YndB with AHSA1/START domain
MATEQYKIEINAPRERVWDVLWGNVTYTQWTVPFHEGSVIETDWKVGGKTFFTDGKGSGMVSTIVENIPNEFISFKHLGMVKDGVEDTSSPEVQQWAGATENYTLKALNGETAKTELTVDMDMNLDEKMLAYFHEAWPKSLQLIKELTEENEPEGEV